MIKIQSLTIKNFMSCGNVTQAVNFNDSGLTLVLGNNLDLGGDGSRNGVGKTTLVNALSYALYGNAITNIRLNNLINKTNDKGMLVTVELDVNGTRYRIERGRKHNILKFIVNDVEMNETDEGQGEGRLTQVEIEKLIGLNHIMFKHLIALNTYNEPFLALRANDQREIIEHLLGITMLSEKAVVLKDLLKTTKDRIKEEEYRINGVEQANLQIEKSIKDLHRRKGVWERKRKDDIFNLEKAVADLESFDVETELEAHVALEAWVKSNSERSDMERAVAGLQGSITREQRRRDKIADDLKAAEDHKCYACGQLLHDEKHAEIVLSKNVSLAESNEVIQTETANMEEILSAIADIGELGVRPDTKYQSAQEAYEHQSKLSTAKISLEASHAAEDPYLDQIVNLEKDALQEISWDTMNNLTNMREHQEFLLKLLTNKDSFVRKRIIEQNLQYLNSRLNYYLSKLGLPHEVQFQSDLNVEITELGRELDFDNLSRGERNRLILGLSWSFRDVHESMNTPIDFMAIDELIDSGMDSNGVESALGVLKKMHRERNKNIFLISHREELVGRVNNILYVVKENGFTSFSPDQEFDIE
jgi:energy-coupling factor transporter ATP-binding protein EcfA2